MKNLSLIQKRKQEYAMQIQQIKDPIVKRKVILEMTEKLIEEFGNENEKIGAKFGLYPLWAMIYPEQFNDDNQNK